jgi:hypothetical protein
MGSPSGGGGRHKLRKAQLDAFGVADVVGHIEVIPEAARAKLEDEAAGYASVHLEGHKGGRGHLTREEKAGTGGGRERGSIHGKGGGAGKVKLAFRTNPKATRGGGRQGERGRRSRATSVANFVVERACLRVRGERGEDITTLRTRGRMLSRIAILRGGGLTVREGEEGVVERRNSLSKVAEGVSLSSQTPSRGARPLGFAHADAARREGKHPKHKAPNLRAAAGAAPQKGRRRRPRRGGRGRLAT